MPDFVANAAGAKAPSAGKVSMGAGNVPFSPGVMSGDLGMGGSAPLARQSPQPQVVPAQAPPAASPPGQVPQAGGGPPGMQQPGMQPINPQFYMQILNLYFEKLLDSTKTGLPIVGGFY